MTEDKVPCPQCGGKGSSSWPCYACEWTGKVTADFRREFLEARAREAERETLLDRATIILYCMTNEELRAFTAKHNPTQETVE